MLVVLIQFETPALVLSVGHVEIYLQHPKFPWVVHRNELIQRSWNIINETELSNLH